MKTLVNKNNPEIRITAPEITLENHCYCLYTDDGYCVIEFWEKDWTLVEEEPVDLKKDWCPAEEEPVELEKEIKEWITPPNPSIDPKKGTISREVYIDCIIVTARHFYKLGLNAKEE